MNMFPSLDNLKLAEGLGAEDAPTLNLFCKGEEIGEIVGYSSRDAVIPEIEEILKNGGFYW